MRIKIRALGQCKENSAKGQDLIDTALAAVDEQVNIMKQVKTIALRATDSIYTDSDRKNLQKENLWQNPVSQSRGMPPYIRDFP